jgi:hypothetical protein
MLYEKKKRIILLSISYNVKILFSYRVWRKWRIIATGTGRKSKNKTKM